MLAGASLGALLVTRAAQFVLLIVTLLEAAAVAVLLRSLRGAES